MLHTGLGLQRVRHDLATEQQHPYQGMLDGGWEVISEV